MLFRCKSFFQKSHFKRKHIVQWMHQFTSRKETHSLPKNRKRRLHLPDNTDDGRKRASFFAPLRAGLTVEAAVALPIFFLCMTAVLQLGAVMENAARFGSALCETSEKMAISAYASEYGEKNSIISGALSAVYAQGSVMKKAGDTTAVKNVNFLMSSFLEEDEMIHLVMTYQIKPLVGGVRIPGVFFLQRGSVRGWTGRKGSGGNDGGNSDKSSGEMVYVTEYGTVYHRDIQCSHIKLSIRQVDKDSLESLRNRNGEIYHSCEKCGKNAGSSVYITDDGNRYHSSLECSGLKRTVEEVSLDELGDLKPCSKCG